MRRALQICLLLLIVVVASLLCLVAYASVSYGIHPQSYDFGTVREGQQIQHVFVLSNPTFRTIDIDQVMWGCACLLPQERPTRIAPLSRCRIPVVLRTQGKSGPVEQRLLVRFKGREPTVLSLRGTVIKDAPDVVEFGRAKKGDMQQREFLLTAYPGVHLSVDHLEYNHRYFDIVYGPDGSGHGNFEFTVTLNARIGYGPFQEKLAIYTNDPVLPTKQVSIRGYILKAVESQLTTLAFGTIAPGEQKSTTVKVFSPYGNEIAIEKIECSRADWLKWEVIPNDQDKSSIMVTVTLGVPTDIAPGIVNDELYIFGKAGETRVRIDTSVSALICARPSGVVDPGRFYPQQ